MSDTPPPLQISETLALPRDAVTQTFAFMARRGAGKTYSATKLCEEMLSAGSQVIALDPVGVWWGLRLLADGSTPSGYQIPVCGGLHADLPMDPAAGARLADLVVDRGISMILDVSMLRKADRVRFAAEFGERLFARKKERRSPLHLFIEEAQVFAPQRVGPDEARMAGAVEDLIRLGRNFGIGGSLISQRPQSVNKEVLNQTECLIALQLSGAHERKAIEEWIVYQGLSKDIVNELPSLERGTAWVWSPSWLRLAEKVQIAPKRTYDASATPELGADLTEPSELAPLDLGELREWLAEAQAQAEADDPKALRKRIRELEEMLEKGVSSGPQDSPKEVVPPGLVYMVQQTARLLREAQEQVCGYEEWITRFQEQRDADDRQDDVSPPEPPAAKPAAAPRRPAAAPKPASSNGRVQLRAGEQRMLEALARVHPLRLTKAQLGGLADLATSGGTWSSYWKAQSQAGRVSTVKGLIGITEAGLQALGRSAPPPARTPAERLQVFRSVLSGGELRMFETLASVFPKGYTKANLAKALGLTASGGTFGGYLGFLRRNELVEEVGGVFRLNSRLFGGKP